MCGTLVARCFAVLVCVWQASCVLQDSECNVIETQPCSLRTDAVSREGRITYSLNANFSLCSDRYNESEALIVSTWSSEAATDSPLVFVTRQRKAVDSWTIPFLPHDFQIHFNQVSRTLCQKEKCTDINSSAPLAYVDVFTSSVETVTFNVIFQPVANYSLREGIWYSVLVGASTPQVRVFTFPHGVDTVTIQAEANSSRCAILSIQNNTCPINDLLEGVKSRGQYQTMSTDGFLTVTKDTVNNDSFLVVLITTNYSECHSSDYVPQSPLIINRTVLGFDQTIQIIIRRLEAAPVLPILLPLIVFGCFYIITFVCIFLEGRVTWKIRWSPFCKLTFTAGQTEPGVDDDDADMSLRAAHSTYGSTNLSEEDSHAGSEGTTSQDSPQQSTMEVNEKELRLPHMCKSSYSSLQSQYTVYSWNTVTVGIFYALPAFQLVLSQQLLANSSGKQDLCYYNFKCAHPVGVFNSFNNVWSNVSYFLLGFLFIIITYIRKRRYTALRCKNEHYYENHGIPQFYGIYYAMGMALIIEGFMSSLYHTCPTNANFQFDTAFMFIIAGLILTKMFQNRHPDVHVNAFIAFFSFAVIIFFTLLGIHYDHRNPVAVRFTLLIVVLAMVVGFFISFYYFHRWQFSKEMFVKVFRSWKLCSCTLLHRVRFVKLFSAFCINIIIAFVVIIGHSLLDFATTILLFFLVNVVLFLSFYIWTKLCYREPWTPLPLILPEVIAGLWAAALYFFFSAVADWEKTPAESRALNRPCVLMGFYDSHDIWHFLSASALFLSFIFFMTIDDGIADWKRKEIRVF